MDTDSLGYVKKVLEAVRYLIKKAATGRGNFDGLEPD
jgi:hypothetical protein